MLKYVVTSLVAGLFALLLPAAASAQATLAGVVKDSSGAVMPGVTVEAASDALIEKVRTATTDSAGQFRIVDLPAGSYNVTFTLTGFATVKRLGIELTGNRTASVDTDLKVGEVAEAITITGDAPTVDVRSTVRQDVLSGELMTELPSARNIQNVTILIPGMSVSGTLDVGGLRAGSEVNNFSAHGGRVDDGRLQLDGMTVGGPTGGAGANSGGGGTSYFQPDMGNAAELAVTTSGALGEAESGGPVINVIPQAGGNLMKGAFYGAYANDHFQGKNLDDELKAQQAAGRLATEELLTLHEVSGSFGGPIQRDRIWFFASARTKNTEKRVPIFYNLNSGLFPNLNIDPRVDPSYLYSPDQTQRAYNDSRTHAGNVRLTWQATTRQKFNFYFDEQNLKDNHQGGGTATTSPEAAATGDAYPQHLLQIGWQAPWTARLLLDATFSSSTYDYGGRERDGNATRDLIRITDIGTQGGVTGVTYRSMNWNENHAFVPRWKAAAAYVTGSHNFKVGVQGFMQEQDNRNYTSSGDVTYTFNNGVPSSFTMWGANPIRYRSRAFSNSIYAQDQWTLKRLTVQAAARYDYAKSVYPHQTFGGSKFHPAVYDFPTDSTRRRHRLPRHQSARRRHLRSVRRWQDGTEVQCRPLYRFGVERRTLGARQPAQPTDHNADPQLDRHEQQSRSRTATSTTALRTPTSATPAVPSARRSARPRRRSPPPTIPTCSRAGTRGRWTGSWARPCSARSPTESPWKSDGTDAGPTSGPSSKASSAAPPTFRSTRLPRLLIRDWATSAAG